MIYKKALMPYFDEIDLKEYYDGMKADIEKMQHYFQREDIINAKNKPILPKVESSCRRKEWDHIQEYMVELMKDVMAINVEELSLYMENSLKDLHKVEGKDVILIIGEKKVGKSLMVNYLSGQRIKVVKVDNVLRLDADNL